MSLTLTITGNKSVLETEFNPPLTLDGENECGLLYFSTFNAISNINEGNNVFAYGKNKTIVIPCGTYDLFDIYKYLSNHIKDCHLKIEPNINTFKCNLYCTEPIDFKVKNSIGPLLGFSKVSLISNKWHESDKPVNILPLSVIRIECDLIQGSYTNGVPTHIIHEFVLNTPPGHQLIEIPRNVIYFPVKKSHISSISVKVLDLKGNLINFKEEDIHLSLHIRKTK